METQEPDVTPGPLETGHISPEEEFSQISRQNVWTIDGLLSDTNAPRYQVCARFGPSCRLSLTIDRHPFQH